jgi:hypothetical protein
VSSKEEQRARGVGEMVGRIESMGGRGRAWAIREKDAHGDNAAA